MIVVPGDNTVWIDVDDTLVIWAPHNAELEKRGIEIVVPGGLILEEGNRLVPGADYTVKILPHRFHVEQVKRHKLRGHTVIVWSAGGSAWAATAVKALGLEPYVDLVISKPAWIYDDKKPEEFMPAPYWFEDKEAVDSEDSKE